MSATERRALLLLLALGLARPGRPAAGWSPSGAPPGQVELLQALPPVHPLAASRQHLGAGAPPRPGRADRCRPRRRRGARPAAAGRHGTRQAHRGRSGGHGPFGGLPALDRVPGIGPGLLGALPCAPELLGAHLQRGRAWSRAGATAKQARLRRPSGRSSLAPLLPTTTGLCPAQPGPAGPTAEVHLPTPRPGCVPGIGPARAASIVQYRGNWPISVGRDLGRSRNGCAGARSGARAVP